MRAILSERTAVACFAPSHVEATRLFLTTATEQGFGTTLYPHPLRGPHGEDLVTATARIGPPDATRLLLCTSGVHGLEGLAGSGCQVAWLRSGTSRALPDDTAALLVHLVNPWGTAWRRRQTEDNVDLNRNFMDFDQPLPRNEAHEELYPAIACREPERWAQADAAIAAFRRDKGDGPYATAVFAGQYDRADSVGFGGTAPTWSNRTLHRILDEQAGPVRETLMLDIHTGLGPYGYGTLLTMAAEGSQTLDMLFDVYGPSVAPCNAEGRNPYKISGPAIGGLAAHLPGTVLGLGIEFGTFDTERLFRLQIEDCRRTDPRDPRRFDADTRASLLQFFHPATPDWMHVLALRTLQIAGQAVDHLRLQLGEPKEALEGSTDDF